MHLTETMICLSNMNAGREVEREIKKKERKKEKLKERMKERKKNIVCEREVVGREKIMFYYLKIGRGWLAQMVMRALWKFLSQRKHIRTAQAPGFFSYNALL